MTVRQYVRDAQGWLDVVERSYRTQPAPPPPPPVVAGIAPPHPLLSGPFDPRSYDYAGLTGRTNPAAPLTVFPDTTGYVDVHQRPGHLLAGVEVLGVEVNVDSVKDAVVEESRIKAIRVAGKNATYVECRRCELENLNGNTYTGGGPLWFHHNKTIAAADSCSNFKSLLSGGYTLIEYNHLRGLGYVQWAPLSGAVAVPCSMTNTSDTITATAHGLTVGKRVMFYPTGQNAYPTAPEQDTLPGDLRHKEMFYVHSVVDADHFRIQRGTKTAPYQTLGLGGAAVTFTEDAVGRVILGAADGLHSDGAQVYTDGWTTIRRNRIEAHPNCCLIIKGDEGSTDGLNKPITNVRVEDNLFIMPTGQGTVFIYCRAGSVSSTTGYSPGTGGKGRPHYVTIINNWFDGATVSPISAGGSGKDQAQFVQTEQARADAVARQIADPAVLTRRTAFMHTSMTDARSWIVWANNRWVSSGAVIPPPRTYYTGE